MISKNAEEDFILPVPCAFHLLFKFVSSDGELQPLIGSKPSFLAKLPVTRAKSSVVAGESFGISTLPVIVLDFFIASNGGLKDGSTLVVFWLCGIDEEVVNCVWDDGVDSIGAWGKSPFSCVIPQARQIAVIALGEGKENMYECMP